MNKAKLKCHLQVAVSHVEVFSELDWLCRHDQRRKEFCTYGIRCPFTVLSDEPSPRVHPCPITLPLESLPLEISPSCPVEIKALNPYHTQPKPTGTNLTYWNQPTSLPLSVCRATLHNYCTLAGTEGGKERKTTSNL